MINDLTIGVSVSIDELAYRFVSENIDDFRAFREKHNVSMWEYIATQKKHDFLEYIKKEIITI